MRSSAFAVAALFAASLSPVTNAVAQRPGSDTTNVFTPEMKLFSNPDPRIAQFEQSQRSGTPVRGIGAVELSPDGKQIAWIVASPAAEGAGRGGNRRSAGLQLPHQPGVLAQRL